MHPEYQKIFNRNFEQYWIRKVEYCKKHKRLDLLSYGDTLTEKEALSMYKELC